MSATLSDVALPPETRGGRVLVDVALDMGGLLEREEQLFHVAGDGRTLRSH